MNAEPDSETAYNPMSEDVPVSVWALTGGVPAQESTVEAPTEVGSWTMRTLPSDEVLATYEGDLRD